MVIDRGHCPFTKKAYYSQLAGADAVMIVDDRYESLVTMDAADDDETSQYVNNISVPVGLILKSTGDLIEPILGGDNPEPVLVMLNWTDVLPHPDERVEWEFWTNSGDNCGAKCDQQKGFIRDFAPVAQTLEMGGYTQFTPHYVTWLCPPQYIDSPDCVSQCINNGRYCCPDPDDDFEEGYSGRDVVIENLRTLCVFRLANATGAPWKWWDYVVDFEEKCTMEAGTYGDENCATAILSDMGLDIEDWRACVGDPDANAVNELLEAEQEAQVDDGERGDVTILPTVVINERQYRGKLERSAVLRTICSGFKEGQAPDECDDEGFLNNKCAKDAEGYAACAANAAGDGLTGCEVTNEFPFYQCVCPKGSQKVTSADGTSFACESVNGCRAAIVDTPSCSCERCWCQNLGGGDISCHEEPESVCNATAGSAHPGGCWSDGEHHACFDNIAAKKAAGLAGDDPRQVRDSVCKCPEGFSGDGLNSCVDVDECATRCKGERMRCKNTVGSFECECEPGFAMVFDQGSTEGRCFAGSSPPSNIGVIVAAVVASCAILAGGAFLVYRWRLRSYMDQEIRAIMSQYMPLEDQAGANGNDDDDAELDDAVIRRNVRDINAAV
jgi:hypothetical protein